QPPSTPLAAAIFARVSPSLTSTVRPPPVAVAVTFLGVAGVACGATLIESGLPCSPSLREQAGQAPQPCLASTRSATTICSTRDASWARPPPPKARQVLGVNWRPPLKPLPVLIAQFPLLS